MPRALLLQSEVPRTSQQVPWMYWDSEALTAVSALSPDLFTNPAGKTFFQTNMRQPSTIPEPQVFYVNWMGFAVFPSIGQDQAVADHAQGALISILEDSYAELVVSNKSMLEGPLHRFPAGGGPFGNTFVDATTPGGTVINSIGTNGLPSAQARFYMNHPVAITAQEDFHVSVSWGHVIDVGGLTSPRLFCFLGGVLQRGIL